MKFYRQYHKDGHLKDPASSYCKLGLDRCLTVGEMKSYLTQHNFPHLTGITKETALDLVGACQRGLPSYELHSFADLKICARHRGMRIGDRKWDLKRRLEDADEGLVFRILKLPPEMRLLIYTFYLDSLEDLPRSFEMPPLTRVRELSAETMPVFWSRYPIPIVLEQTRGRWPRSSWSIVSAPDSEVAGRIT
jgi:hypothetical protein